jgi:hypothetical protein
MFIDEVMWIGIIMDTLGQKRNCGVFFDVFVGIRQTDALENVSHILQEI